MANRRRPNVLSPRFVGLLLVAVVVLPGPTPSRAENPTAGSQWIVDVPKRGGPRGETQVSVRFREHVERAPLTFGIPLGQVESPNHVTLIDEQGNPVPADFTALGDWRVQPARWVLVSCVVDAPDGGGERSFTLRWGEEPPAYTTLLNMRRKGGRIRVANTHYSVTLDPTGIGRIRVRGKGMPLDRWCPMLSSGTGELLRPENGAVQILHDGAVHKALRTVSMLSETVELHQEYRFYADSPFVRCDVRFINRAAEDMPVSGIAPLSAKLGRTPRIRAGLERGTAVDASSLCIRQHATRWEAAFQREGSGLEEMKSGTRDDLGEWLALRWGGRNGLTIVCPYFQELAAGDENVASELSFDDGELLLRHYIATGTGPADVRLREGMARTFTYWLVLGVEPGGETAAQAVKALPYVAYDREHLTSMGVFREHAVSHLYDEELVDAGRYYLRARVPRLEYPRCTRGADRGPDKSGEGMHEVDLHAGGMVFGEVFQYFTPEPTDEIRRLYVDQIGLDPKCLITGGRFTYRNGDIVLALYEQYLRSGHCDLRDFARIHGQVFADVSVSHAWVSEGLGHYYCDWYGNPYVYQRFEGLLLGALVTGDTWWFDTARAMADYCVRAWVDEEPRDGAVDGGLHGVQYRSAYIAKMLLKMYEVTGDRTYADTAVRLAEWIMPRQEPEGWWRDVPHATRAYRNSPIFAAYTCVGLWPLYHATDNRALLETLLKAAEYQRSMQEDVSGNNPGTFPNSYWYRREDGPSSTQPIPEHVAITGNYAVTSHWANLLLRAFLATGDQGHFYSANAAWTGVLNSLTPEGGVPLSNSRHGSVWGHAVIEALPTFAATAEERGLPIVLSAKAVQSGDSFMGKGASFEKGVFRFGLKYRNPCPLPVRVFLPSGPPAEVTLDEQPIRHAYSVETRILQLEAPASADFRTALIRIR